MELLDRLLEHDRWGTATLLVRSRSLTGDQLDQRFDIGHESILTTFNHVIYYTGFWTGVMAGEPVEEERTDRTVAALIDRHERVYAAFAALARRVRDEERLDETFTDHFGEQMTFGGGILHVVFHNAEHRTEIVHIMQRLGLPEVPEVDHGLFDFWRRGLFQP
ncbi:MAG: DinB family protein [Thermomicrobiales bacterium]|nr:DinB family protein [Thermomicrobiales bacterium]